MNIKEISIKGFKGYKDCISYDLYYNTLIEGSNKLGKTSIGEAITWCLYGCNLMGNDKSDADLMNQDSDSMEVTLTFTYKENECILVRKKGKSLSIKLNNQKVSQKELLSFLPAKDLFLAIFNTVTFISQAPNKCRTQFMNMLPNIDVTDVINEYNRWDIYDVVTKYGDINEGISSLNNKIKEFDDKILKLDGEENSLKHLLVEILASEFPDEILFSDDDEMKLKELQTDIEKLNKSELVTDTKTLELQIKDIKEAIIKENNKNCLPEGEDVINSMKSEIANCTGQMIILTKNLNNIKDTDGYCLACGQNVSKEHKNAEVIRITDEINSLNETITSYESTIEMFEDINKENLSIFNAEKNKILAALKNDLENLNKNLVELKDKYKSDLILFEENKIKKFNSYKEELKKYEDKKQNVIMLNNQKTYVKNTKSNYEAKLNFVQASRKELNSTISSLNIEKSLLIEYNTFYVEYLNKLISTYFTNVTIDLFKVSKTTGEISDTFRLNYEGKRYTLLSNAERVLVSLELSNMFNKALGVQLPIFIDNGESILEIPTLDTQMIIAKVIESEIKVYPNNIVNEEIPEVEVIRNNTTNNDEYLVEEIIYSDTDQMSFM